MPNPTIAYRRLHNQHLTGRPFSDPVEVVRWLVAVQSQDYTGAKWALGLRSAGIKEADVDAAFNAGAILRTHVLRPTWHFVLPEDIRWLLALTAPRVHALNAPYYRREGLDERALKRGVEVLAAALEGGQFKTRPELAAALGEAGIIAEKGLPLIYIVMHAELEGIICSGPRRGKQFTYALLDERAPGARTLPRDQALAELTLRFFRGRGPATPHDFSKWSGLTLSDARAGLAMAGSRLVEEAIGGVTYWLDGSSPARSEPSSEAFWLPNYDEVVSSYADLSALIDPETAPGSDSDLYRTYPHPMLVSGRMVGVWRRVIEKQETRIEPQLFRPLSDAEVASFNAAAARYSAFLERPVVLRW
jgi:hypothetical protein